MNILAVEDDRSLRRFMGMALRQMGHTYESYSDVDKLFEQSIWEEYVYILPDLILKRGERSSLELLIWLNKNKIKPYRIVITGWPSMRTFDDVTEQLADRIMSKPVDMDKLQAVLMAIPKDENEVDKE